ncbi:MAG: hypothetical protein WCQ47_08285, partial [bacterium]
MEPENDNNLKDEILVNYLKSKAYKDLTWQEQDILFKKAPGFITEEMAQAHLDSLVKPSSKEKQNPQQILEIEYENFKSDFPSDSKEISYKIAQYLVDKHHAKTIGEKVRNIYIYKDGIYILGINFLKEEIQEILEEHASTHHKNNIIEMVKDLTLTDRKEFKADENLINL